MVEGRHLPIEKEIEVSTGDGRNGFSRRRLLTSGAGVAGLAAGSGLLGPGSALASIIPDEARRDAFLQGGQPLKAILSVTFATGTTSPKPFSLPLWGYSVVSGQKPTGGGGAGKPIPYAVTITAPLEYPSFETFLSLLGALVDVRFTAEIAFTPTAKSAKTSIRTTFVESVVTAVDQMVFQDPLTVHKSGGDLLQIVTFEAAGMTVWYEIQL